MALQKQRERSRTLRVRGKSIAEIAHTLSASKSTVSYWCRDIVLSSAQQRALAKKQASGGAAGRLRAAEVKRAARVARQREAASRGEKDIGTVSRRDLFMLGVGLYWGEGYKTGNEECGLTNSDPAIIRACIAWLNAIYGVQNKHLILRVSINDTHRHRKNDVEKYWSAAVRVPLSQFTKTSLDTYSVKESIRELRASFWYAASQGAKGHITATQNHGIDSKTEESIRSEPRAA